MDETYYKFNDEEKINLYRQQTDEKQALENLLGTINTAQQGYLPIWATGFKQLDEKLDGGFLGGNLILLGAISSLGKTTFALQIAENIAAQGNDVLVFSLEMSKDELYAKSISRNTFKLTDNEKDVVKKSRQVYRLTMGDVLRGRVGRIGEDKRRLFDEALAETQKLNSNMYIIRDNKISVRDIEELITVHSKARPGRKPFVIIDYLQILKPKSNGKQSSDKRQLVDEDVNNLKDIAVRLGVPIMVISSFNRASYLEPVNMGSFKESGNIEYSSDTLIGLQYSGMVYKKHYFTKKDKKRILVYESKLEHDSRVRQLLDDMDKDGADGKFLPIDIVVLKNRGVSKGKILFRFCPRYNIFQEIEPEKQLSFAQQYDWDADEIEDSSPVVSSGDSKSLGKV